MLTAHLETRFREILDEGVRSPERDESIHFAVEFSRLLAQVLPDEVSQPAIQAMESAIRARTSLDQREIGILLSMVLAPAARSTIKDHELRAFGSRFGNAEEEALRAAAAEEVSLAAFAESYGSAEALLLLDSLFAVCAVDGLIDRQEIGRLQRSATELGIDPMLVGALFRKHDLRHATGDFRFELDDDTYVVGRSGAAGIQLPDPQVAIRHAELMRTPDGWRIVDLRSGRPTLINGAPVGSAPFRHGDVLRVGPYTLSLDKEEANLTAFGMQAFSALSVRKLSRQIRDITLLDDVNFTVFSGEVIALVGPSGAGKTTLLNAIAGIAPADTGDVLLDGQSFHDLLQNDRSIVGIVPQDDVVHAELTVEESLYYAARLRFPRDVDDDTINGRVDQVLEELGIAHIRHSRIGNAVQRGISGGQRKRVNLGQELLTQSTKVLFLDEPTSGLDPQTAQDIVSLVRQLADDGRIVFLVTHDVTPSVLSMVDHLLVLAPGGRVAWFGPPDQACNYFQVGSADEIFARLPDQAPRGWARSYRDGPAFRKFVRTRQHLLGLDGLEVATGTARSQVRRSWWLQFSTLSRRYARVKVRDAWGTAVLLSQAPILALAMIVVFPEPDVSMIFMLALSAFWFGASGSIRELIAERTIWRREARVGLGITPYMASKVTVMGTLVGIQCTLLAGLNWYFLGMADPYLYSAFGLIGVTILTGLVGMALGLMISSLFSSSVAAVGSLPLWLIPQITFGGLLVKVKDMELLAKGVSWLMVTRYSFEAMVKTGEKLSVPDYRGDRTDGPINGELYKLGFRSSDSYDMGIPMTDLILVMVLFFIIFMLVATLFTARARRGN